MVADDAKRPPTALRIKVRYADVDAFVERFAVNVSRTAIFISTRTPKPVGHEIRFEIRLADDRAVLVGQGVVRAVKALDPARPRAPAGMVVEFQRVSRESRDLLLRMHDVRRRMGIRDADLPLPHHDDAGDELDTQVRSTPARTTPPAPAPAPPHSESARTAPAQTRGISGAETAAETMEAVEQPAPPPPPAAPQPPPVRIRPNRRTFEQFAATQMAAVEPAEADADRVDVAAAIALARSVVSDEHLAMDRDAPPSDAAPEAIAPTEASSRLAALFGTVAMPARSRQRLTERLPTPNLPAPLPTPADRAADAPVARPRSASSTPPPPPRSASSTSYPPLGRSPSSTSPPPRGGSATSPPLRPRDLGAETPDRLPPPPLAPPPKILTSEPAAPEPRVIDLDDDFDLVIDVEPND